MTASSALVRAAIAAALLALGDAPLSAQSAPAAPQRSAADGVYTEAQAQRGEMTFRRVCAACHTIADFSGEPFLKIWPTAGGLFDVISTTMPQDQPGSLTPQQYAEVLAFFLKTNGFKAGTAELPREMPALNAIAIPARPPR